MSLEEAIVKQAMTGDRDAFAHLLQQRITHLYGTAALILGDRGVAEDAAQEALIRCWRSLPGLRDPSKFDAWLYRLLLRACLDEARGKTTRIEAHLPESRFEPVQESEEFQRIVDSDELNEPLLRLNPDQRALLVLLYYRGHTLREASEILGVRVGTVKSRLHRSLHSLRASLTVTPESEPLERKAMP